MSIKHVDIALRFPSIFEQCLKLGIDIRKDPIPVVPAAHFFCGGIKVDLNGQTDLDSPVYSIEHKISLSKGGENIIENMTVCCRKCNCENNERDQEFDLYE